MAIRTSTGLEDMTSDCMVCIKLFHKDSQVIENLSKHSCGYTYSYTGIATSTVK